MAQRYRSSRSGSGRSRAQESNGRGSRGGYRQPARGGGGGAGPIVLAVVLVVVAVGAVIALSSGGDDKDSDRSSRSSSSSSTHPTTREPDVPQPPAYPPLPAHVREKAKAVADKARELKKQGEAVYQVAMDARRAEDQDLWQAKLSEAAEYFEEIKELYNELLGEVPSNDHYDEEQVANHYLGREAEIVMQAMRRLTDIKKQRRM